MKGILIELTFSSCFLHRIPDDPVSSDTYIAQEALRILHEKVLEKAWLYRNLMTKTSCFNLSFLMVY